jgi:hypothetical protein
MTMEELHESAALMSTGATWWQKDLTKNGLELGSGIPHSSTRPAWVLQPNNAFVDATDRRIERRKKQRNGVELLVRFGTKPGSGRKMAGNLIAVCALSQQQDNKSTPARRR